MPPRGLAAAAVTALVACGRVGFDVTIAPSDAPAVDDAIDARAFVPPRGLPDPTFGSGGDTIVADSSRTVSLFDLAPRDAGVLAVGLHGVSGAMRIGLFAFTDAGALDPTFGSIGIRDVGPTSDDYAYTIARVDAGRFAIAGQGTDTVGSTSDDSVLGVIGADGVPDPAFGTAGFDRFDASGGADIGNAFVLEADASYVVCGGGDYNATDEHFILAYTDAAGGVPAIVKDDFVANTDDECLSIVARPGGGVIAGGYSGARLVVAAYDAVGVRDSAWNAGHAVLELSDGLDGAARALAIASTGKIVIAGDDDNGGLVARLNADGTLDPTFGTGGIVSLPAVRELDSVVVQPDGALVVAGDSNQTGQDGLLLRLTRAGALDPAFGSGGVVTVATGMPTVLRHVVLDANDRLVVVGTIGQVGNTQGLIARFD